MKITPLDIQQREFKVGLRGYDREEVQAFLRAVSLTLEELIKENMSLREGSAVLEAELGELRKREAAFNELLVASQGMAEGLKQSARREAELVLKEAEIKAEDLLLRAQAEYGGLQREVQALQKQRILAIEKLRTMLQTFHKMLQLEELDQGTLSDDHAGKGGPRDQYEGL